MIVRGWLVRTSCNFKLIEETMASESGTETVCAGVRTRAGIVPTLANRCVPSKQSGWLLDHTPVPTPPLRLEASVPSSHTQGVEQLFLHSGRKGASPYVTSSVTVAATCQR